MRSILLLAALVSLVTATAAQGPQAIIDSQAFLDANSSVLPPLPAEETRRIDQLLRQMTVAEHEIIILGMSQYFFTINDEPLILFSKKMPVLISCDTPAVA